MSPKVKNIFPLFSSLISIVEGMNPNKLFLTWILASEQFNKLSVSLAIPLVISPLVVK